MPPCPSSSEGTRWPRHIYSRGWARLGGGTFEVEKYLVSCCHQNNLGQKLPRLDLTDCTCPTLECHRLESQFFVYSTRYSTSCVICNILLDIIHAFWSQTLELHMTLNHSWVAERSRIARPVGKSIGGEREKGSLAHFCRGGNGRTLSRRNVISYRSQAYSTHLCTLIGIQ